MKSVAGIAVAIACSACTLKVPSGVGLRVELPHSKEPIALQEALTRPGGMGLIPSNIGQMDCYLLNVNGPGIDADNSGSGQQLSFLDLGLTSTLAAPTDGFVSMHVPSGLARTIQVLGIAGNP